MSIPGPRTSDLERHRGFARFAWALLAYILLVILFGAWVRISGSGAGCGDHWPTCHGELIPRTPELETVIEYTHRVTSGVLGPLTLALLVWAIRGAGRRRIVIVCAALTTFLIVVEALIGAGLVLGQLVADDDSVARAVVIALHLGNTLLLTAVAALTAWFGAGRRWFGFARSFTGRTPLLLAMIAMVLVCMAGAVTALGDTLFPVSPTTGEGMFARIRDDLSPGAHFLVRLRIVHPVLAVALSGGLWWLSVHLSEKLGPSALPEARGLWHSLRWIVWTQLVAGGLTIALHAPVWLQLTHLLLAQISWIVLVLSFVAATEAAHLASGDAQNAGGYGVSPL